jgi:hypothetical protein
MEAERTIRNNEPSSISRKQQQKIEKIINQVRCGCPRQQQHTTAEVSMNAAEPQRVSTNTAGNGGAAQKW